MNTKKHTLGPWNISAEHSDDRHIVIDLGERKGCVLIERHIVGHDMSDQANAALVAAAPEMLEALKRIIQSAPFNGLPLALETDIQNACHVIAQAEGRDK